MTFAIFQFLACALVIVVAGSYLAKFGDQIAEITGLGRLVIGSVLLAGATSLPELTVDITAVRHGWQDLAIGDLLGSCLMNLLILAVLDLIFRSKSKMLSREAAGHALSGTMSIALIALVGAGIAANQYYPQGTFLRLSLAGWGILAAYILGVRMVFLDQRISARTTEEMLSAEASSGKLTAQQLTELPASVQPGHTDHGPLWKPLAGFAVAALAIVLAGPWLAEAANAIAKQTGLGQSFVGTIFVALSTSLPEFVASFTALRMGATDMAVGNVFGSNTFNMAMIAPLDFFSDKPILGAVSQGNLISCLAAVVVTTIAIMGQLYSIEKRRRLIEPDATLMLVVIAAAFYLVYLSSTGGEPAAAMP